MIEADRLLEDAEDQKVTAFDVFLRGCEGEGLSFLEGLERAVKYLRTSVCSCGTQLRRSTKAVLDSDALE